jgi:hypothetical protein
LAAKASKTAPHYSAFISHAKADAKKAEAIAEGLEKRGFKCWIAPRDVKAGRAYGDEIIRGIESAKTFVLVLSKASNDSAFVAREVERAASKKKPIFAVRVADVHPGPALELFISGTQWIDAFPGRLASHVGRLADLLAEEEGRAPESEAPAAPRIFRRWALPLGAAAAVLLVLGAGVAFWPGPQMPQAPEGADPLLTNPVWSPQEQEHKRQEQFAELRRMDAARAQEEAAAAAALAALDTRDRDLLGGARTGAPQMAAGESDDTEMIVGGNSVSPLAAGDPDYRACEKSSGDSAIAACDRAIASGKFKRQSLSYLYNDRGFLLMQKGAIEAALADLNKAIETYPSNFYAYWNRGAIYAAKRDLARAQEDLGMALALNPDEHSSAKIREALNAVSASAAETAQPQASDPSVITDPSQFWGQDDTNSAATLQSGGGFDAEPGIAADALPASPSFETTPMPAAPSMDAMPDRP